MRRDFTQFVGFSNPGLGEGHPSPATIRFTVPLTIFDIKGIPATRREGIVVAVEAGGKHVKNAFEAWISTAFREGIRVVITGPDGFERAVQFAGDEDLVEITERIRATLEE